MVEIANRYWRIMPGAKSSFYSECIQGEFIGGDWDIDYDLTNRLPEKWRDFNKEKKVKGNRRTSCCNFVRSE